MDAKHNHLTLLSESSALILIQNQKEEEYILCEIVPVIRYRLILFTNTQVTKGHTLKKQTSQHKLHI